MIVNLSLKLRRKPAKLIINEKQSLRAPGSDTICTRDMWWMTDKRADIIKLTSKGNFRVLLQFLKYLVIKSPL